MNRLTVLFVLIARYFPGTGPIQIGLNKNRTLGIDYYRMEPIRLASAVRSKEQKILQADLVLKF